MSQPLSEIPKPYFGGRSRRFRSTELHLAFQGVKRRAQQSAQSVIRRVKRNPRTFGLVGGAVVLTLAGAYSLSASGAGRSLCPKNSQFLLLMDPIPAAPAGSELEVYYDVCGLRAGTQYRGKLVLQPQTTSGKKAAKAKPVTVAIRDKADGPATRRRQDVQLGSAKAAAYTLELSVTDAQGRERKKVQKIRIH
jgi:hypothetical protein